MESLQRKCLFYLLVYFHLLYFPICHDSAWFIIKTLHQRHSKQLSLKSQTADHKITKNKKLDKINTEDSAAVKLHECFRFRAVERLRTLETSLCDFFLIDMLLALMSTEMIKATFSER